MSVKRLLSEMDSLEISEWLAYDMTQDEKWIKDYNAQLELEESRKMTQEQKVAAFKKMLGGKQ